VFCRTRVEVDQLTDTLKSHGYGAEALHGGMEQRQRDRVMQLFRQEKADVLVATDVAARGLDIEHVSHVFNYDIPTSPDVYVHRIGRTGRVGREGVAITLVDPREQRMLRQIESVTKQKIEIVALPTAAALREKRLDATRVALQARVAAGGLDQVRAFVATLAHDVDVLDIAAAAVAMLHEADAAAAAVPEPAPAAPQSEMASGPMAVLLVAAGKSAGIRPGDLVGAITGEARVTSKQIGRIFVGEAHSKVEVPEALADRILTALRGTKLRGQRVEVKRQRGA
jgi:ATP-dependent RNA helicase DeaD